MAGEPTRVIYDGDCPFCTQYVRLLKLRESVGPVELVNAREHPDVAADMAARGLDLDEGMVLAWDGQLFHGAECVERIALLSTDSTAFNRVNRMIFQRPRLARLLYPVLRAGRNAVLRLKGVPKIGEA